MAAAGLNWLWGLDLKPYCACGSWPEVVYEWSPLWSHLVPSSEMAGPEGLVTCLEESGTGPGQTWQPL